MSESMCHSDMAEPNSNETLYYQQGSVNSQFTVPRIGPTNNEEHASHKTGVLLDQERFLPIANVSRIMKSQIPGIGKIAKDAKELVQECVSEFISFITSEACERTMKQKRKTISAEDLIDAVELLGFDGYVEPLKLFLSRYKQAHRLNPGPDISSPLNDSHHSAMDDDNDNFKNHDSEHGSPPMLQRQDGVGTSSHYTSNMNASASRNSYMHHPNQLHSQATTSHQPSTAVFEVANNNYVSDGHQNANPTVIENQDDTHSAPMVIMNDGSGGPAFNSEQMSLYIDPVTKQHYMIVQNEHGQNEIYPVIIQGGCGPLPVVSMNEGGNPSIQSESAVMNNIDGAALDPKSMYVTSEYKDEESTSSEVHSHPVTPSRVQPKRSTRSHPYTRSQNHS